MANDKDGDGTNLRKQSLNRRNILLGGTTLAAASAIATGSTVRVAQAQAQPAAPASGKKQNILVIMGDDIGQSDISAYPPRQKPQSFNLDQIMEQLQHPAQSD